MESQKLRNGLPVELVEELLDVVLSVESAKKFDARADPRRIWDWCAVRNGVAVIMGASRSAFLGYAAIGDAEKAAEELENMKVCLAAYYKELK